jgi:retinol dehydrogenase-12
MSVREMGTVTAKDPSKYHRVIVNCMTPGACKSDFNREAKAPRGGLVPKINTALVSAIARSTEVGSRTLIAALEADEESNGAFMENSHVVS